MFTLLTKEINPSTSIQVLSNGTIKINQDNSDTYDHYIILTDKDWDKLKDFVDKLERE